MQFVQEEFVKLHQKLAKAQFPIRATGKSYRVINNWDEKGLLVNERINRNGWRKFDWFELVWTQLIGQMRDFGLAIDRILKVKEQLQAFVELENVKGQKYSVRRINQLVIESMLNHKKFFIHINAKGDVTIEGRPPKLTGPTLVIPLAPIIHTIVHQEEKKYAEQAKLEGLSPEEEGALKLLQSEDYEKAIISFEERAPIIVKGEDKSRLVRACSEAIVDKTYKRVMILRKAGKVFSIDRKG